MKKLLLAAVACCAFATPSFADNNELPEHLWGKWCWDGSGKDIDANKKILDNFRQDDKCWPSKTLTLGRREVKYEMITCRVISAKTALEPKLTAQGSPVLVTKVYWECRTHDGSENERPERYTAYLYASYVGGEISLTVAYENYWRNRPASSVLLPKELTGSWCPIEAGSDKYFKTKDCKTDNPINVRDTGYDDSVDVDCKLVSIRKTKLLAETKAICHDHGSGEKTMENVDWFFSDMKTLRIVKLKISPLRR